MKNNGNFLVAIVGVVISTILSFFIGGWSIKYTIEYWGTILTHTAVVVPFLPCGVAGIFLASIAIVAALATFAVSFFL